MKPDMNAIIDTAPQNQMIQNTLMKMDLKLDHFANPVCSVSGGSDSDTMLDLIERVRGDRPVTYVFFDTGIEYYATLHHLDWLEEKYQIKIERPNADVPVPSGCKRFGLPFLSKDASQKIRALQRNGFRWADKPYEVLLKEYPNAKDGVAWWCNKKNSGYGIEAYPFLKEFMIKNQPTFAISDQCCNGTKKNPGKRFFKKRKANMKITGMRREEGGVRATSRPGCFSITKVGIADYCPLWFWTDTDKAEYKTFYGLTYSDCYEIWGFKRTGCAGCPFNSRFEDDLLTMRQNEPKMHQMANAIFGKSYDYTRAYRVYRDKHKELAKNQVKGQLGMEEL